MHGENLKIIEVEMFGLRNKRKLPLNVRAYECGFRNASPWFRYLEHCAVNHSSEGVSL
jgi:hypothetical protein